MSVIGDELSTLVLLILGCQVSEDLALVTAGHLVAGGEVSIAVALIGCVIGLFVGDMGLWLVGRLIASKSASWPRVKRWFDSNAARFTTRWINRRTGWAVFIVRAVPGTRVAFYLTAGWLNVRGGPLAFWTLLAAMIWTPLVVLSVAWFGPVISRAFESVFRSQTAVLLISILISVVLIRLLTRLASAEHRRAIATRIAKMRHWEFWPAWLAYTPLAVWIVLLSIRYRGFGTVTAANPGVPDGGFLGESKFDILRTLDAPQVARSVRIEAQSEHTQRVADAIEQIRSAGMDWPVILKPDVGQRGQGVRLIQNEEALGDYLRENPWATIAQAYHPGPFEAGVFYYRYPGTAAGRILSITRKEFPVVVGDGTLSLRDLIQQHPRFRFQTKVFFQRHEGRLDDVPRAGEVVSLVRAGNHCQGAIFRDGSDWITPQLEAVIDSIAGTTPHFYFGRFDVRFADLDAFRAGRDLTIIELNGVTSESTNAYDPDWSCIRSYRQLMRQWSILFRIGHSNRQRGFSSTPSAELLRGAFRFYRSPRPSSLAD